MNKQISRLILGLNNHGFFRWLPDKPLLKLVFRARMGKKLDLKAPKTFNEKLQWIKLYDRKPEYKIMVDKLRVRDYIKEKIGEEYLIPLLGTWEKAEDIDFEKLPDKFVLKCNHDSGSVIICKDKEKFDRQKAIEKLKKHLKKGTFYHGREWPYKGIKPCVIAEQYMVDEDNPADLPDYKVMCFGGEPKFIELHLGRFSENHTQDFYDVDWNKTEIDQDGYKSEEVTEKPKQLPEILELSKKLSQGIRHLRVDWYIINQKVYFGELTFFDGSGFSPFVNEKDDLYLGSFIKI